MVKCCARSVESNRESLKQRGYTGSEIAAKAGISTGAIGLLKNGEHRLLRVAESVLLSIEIADAEDIEAQSVLQNAYERRLLRGPNKRAEPTGAMARPFKYRTQNEFSCYSTTVKALP